MAPQDAATPPVPAPAPAPRALSGVEALKQSSRRLRGSLAEELAAPGAQVSEDGYNLLKFHGSYEQYDRDTATERKQRGEDKEYSFMARVRMPGGILTAAQYLALDELADRYGNASLRITTRQGVQFHGVIKGNLKATAQRGLFNVNPNCSCWLKSLTLTTIPSTSKPISSRFEAISSQ